MYRDLGFSYSVGYFLIENNFPEAVQELLPMLVEFLLYCILYRRAERMKHPGAAAWFFGIMVLLHGILFAHAASLDFPEEPPYVTAEGLSRVYLLFAHTTLIQSVGYLIAYLLHLRDFPYRKK